MEFYEIFQPRNCVKYQQQEEKDVYLCMQILSLYLGIVLVNLSLMSQWISFWNYQIIYEVTWSF